MPWLDWQFYVVTATALWAAWSVLRQLLPKTGPAGPVCGACAASVCACVKKPVVITTTTPDSLLVVLQDRRTSRR